MKYKKILLIPISFILIILSLISYAIYIEPNWITIKKYPIESTKIPDNLNKMKIIFISDIDIHDERSFKHFKKTIEKIKKINADVIILGGDIFDNTIYEYEQVLTELKSITATHGKFAVLGEKDYAFLPEIESLLFQADFELIQNRSHRIYYRGAPITLISLDNIVAVDNFIPEHMRNDFTIAIIHQPDSFLTTKNEPIDLQLSGHSYGGVIAIPFLHLFKIPGALQYYQGHYHENNKQLIVSNGIGLGDYNYRFLAPPQIVVVELISKIAIDDPVPVITEEDSPNEEGVNNEAQPQENQNDGE